jgi:putative SOS response-associated peptidase YedK
MCGKFLVGMSWGEYCELAGVDAEAISAILNTVTPMSRVPVVHLGSNRKRRITAMRWGWFDRKLINPMRGFSHLHARSEEIDRTPTWVEPFRISRGVVFARSFNIGETLPGGRTKQWVCSRLDGEPMALAVIHSAWQTVQGSLAAFAMVTTASSPPLNTKDERMPALLELDEVGKWIGEQDLSPAELKALLRPYIGELVMREQDGGRVSGQADLF